MTAKQFNAVLEEMGLSREAAARALGLSRRSVISYAYWKGALPRKVELMLRGLMAERRGMRPR
jgi:hypothetical protein